MNFIAFGMYVAITTFTPGPNNLMAMSNGLHTGFRRTIKFLIGVFVGFIVVKSVCAFANFAFMTLVPSVHKWLNWSPHPAGHTSAWSSAPSLPNMNASSTWQWGFYSFTPRLPVLICGDNGLCRKLNSGRL